MFPYAIGAIIGAVLMGRTKPKTRLRTLELFGPRTGAIYTAEVMPGENVVVLHARDSTIALFHREENGRFRLLKALQGFDETIQSMKSDLEPDALPPAP